MSDKEKFIKFTNINNYEIIKDAVSKTFENIAYLQDSISTCYNYVGELLRNEYKGSLSGRRGIYTFQEIFEEKIFYELLKNDLIIDDENICNTLYEIIYTTVNRMRICVLF